MGYVFGHVGSSVGREGRPDVGNKWSGVIDGVGLVGGPGTSGRVQFRVREYEVFLWGQGADLGAGSVGHEILCDGDCFI